MEKQRIVAAGLLVLALAGGCAPRPRLSGAWVGREGTEETTLSFRADGSGHRLTSRGVEEFRYSVDYSRDPVAVDLQMNGEAGRAGRVLGIVHFDRNGRVQVKLGPPGGPRPTAFTRDAPGLTLRRPASR